jgi:leucyl/phenylalanyl-tRNA---protein transferase
MIVKLHPTRFDFPDISFETEHESVASGLVAVGGDLQPERLLAAYRRGIFPWFNDGDPLLWWSPTPRMVLKTADFKLHPSLRKTLRRFVRTPGCEVRLNTATPQVLEACAQSPRAGQNGTWIVQDMQTAYAELARLGFVHSVETWVNGALVGGLYGLRLGRMFFGESMFARANDASKIALCALVALCRQSDIPWIDCQQNTRHLASLGAAEVSGAEFRDHLARTVDEAASPSWENVSIPWHQVIP